MKSKYYIFVLLSFVTLLMATMTVISNAPADISNVYSAYSLIKQAKKLDSEFYQNKVIEYQGKIQDLSKQKEQLNTKLEDIKKEMSSYNSNTAEDLGPMTSDLMYSKLVEAGNLNGAKVIKYYSYENESYMTSIIGTLGQLNGTVQNLKDSLSDWRVDIGNYSLRENYDAYDLKRTYDDGTQMTWYDNKIINALGEVISLDDFVIEEDEDTGIKYSITSLDDVKFDTEGRNAELTASNSYYENKMNEALKNYGNQLTILQQADYTDEVKVELKTELDNNYLETVDGLKKAKEAAAKSIEAKYQVKYEKDKKHAAYAIETYEQKVKELRGMLIDSSSIEYRLDLTFIS